MTRVNIYRVDSVVQAYAKEPSNGITKLRARHKRLTTSKRFTTAFPRYGQITVTEGRGWGSYADYADREIRLGGNASEAVLLHEIAHHVARRHAAYGYCADHGHGFASALLDVVRIAQGAEAERALKHTYKAIGIRVYKAASSKGAAVRVRGEAPEKVAARIAEIAGVKKARAQERAYVRKALEHALAVFEPQQVPCPIDGCGGDAELEFTHHYTGHYRSVITFEIRHDPCTLHEYGKVRQDWWRERRFKKTAAHS